MEGFNGEQIATIIVALVTAVGAVIVAIVQYGKKKDKEVGEANAHAHEAENVAEVIERKSSASETAMARVAEKSLNLLENLLAAEKEDNNALRDLLAASNIENAELKLALERKDQRITELEHELERLRGRLDSLLQTQNDTSFYQIKRSNPREVN